MVGEALTAPASGTPGSWHGKEPGTGHTKLLLRFAVVALPLSLWLFPLAVDRSRQRVPLTLS